MNGRLNVKAAPPSSIGSLSDVDTTGVIGGYVLKWDGSKWTPQTDAGGALTNLGAAASGVNSDITSLTGISDGGTVGVTGAEWTFDGTNDDISTTGNVGIGTTSPKTVLDVNGAVKLGSQTTCDADAEGALRYSGGAMPFCNGSEWRLANMLRGTISGANVRYNSDNTVDISDGSGEANDKYFEVPPLTTQSVPAGDLAVNTVTYIYIDDSASTFPDSLGFVNSQTAPHGALQR